MWHRQVTEKCRHRHVNDVSPGCQDLTGVCPVSIRLVTRDCQLALTLELPWDRCLAYYCLLILHFLKRLLLPLLNTPWGSLLTVTKMVTMVPFSQLLPTRGSMSKLCSTESSLNTLLTGKCLKYQSLAKQLSNINHKRIIMARCIPVTSLDCQNYKTYATLGPRLLLQSRIRLLF